MIILGLTGSIGMGKTTTAAMFAEEGVPVYDADSYVHALYEPGGAAIAPVEAAFPGVVQNGRIDRELLSQRLAGDPEALKRLEAIVHPLVREKQVEWLRARFDQGAKIVVLDVPLLFETGAAQLMDAVVVVSAAPEVQRARVLSRPGMTLEKFEMLSAKQTPDSVKREGADFVINTGLGLEEARAQVRAVLAAIREDEAPHAAAFSSAGHTP